MAATLLGPDGKVRTDNDFVFFKNPHFQGCTLLSEDTIEADLTAIQASVDRILITASAEALDTHFGTVSGRAVHITSPSPRAGPSTGSVRRGSSLGPGGRTIRNWGRRRLPNRGGRCEKVALKVSYSSRSICCVRTQIFSAQGALSSVRHSVTADFDRWIEGKRGDVFELAVWIGSVKNCRWRPSPALVPPFW
ncbi:hypothetical protein E5720_18000 [Rhodococcus sp. PAMC28707]|nr:hypothetical protein E5769_17525 [Rhodococcus sp. PAMC28705]QCB60093.1 hypothetical protein E5720_18000 [Rhodococcus sp. PAMC28707]